MNSLVNERETMKYYWNEFNEAGTKISTPSVFYYLCIHIHTTLLRFFFSSFGKTRDVSFTNSSTNRCVFEIEEKWKKKS